MHTLNSAFEHVMVINRAARTDRWANVEAQCKKFDIRVERFLAHEAADCMVNGVPNANFACTASHRGCLELQLHHGWKTMLVLEDDFQIVDDAFPEMFDAQWSEVPDDWDWIWLGAGYAEDAQYRINGSVIRANRLLTTSSYAITLKMALRVAPHVSGIGPIDSLYGGWQREAKTYVLSPRLMVQAPGMSDLTGLYSINSNSMSDQTHESKL